MRYSRSMLLARLAVIVIGLLSGTTRLNADTLHGAVFQFDLVGRPGYVVEPAAGRRTFPTRWVWFMGGNFLVSGSENERYANALLDEGYVIATVGVGVGCGSPGCVRVMEDFYQHVTATYGLDPKARLLVQSNGGLAGYAFASSHPDQVERIGGIYPAVDFRSWPGVDKLIASPPDVAFTPADLANLDGVNPINLLAPIAAAKIPIFHLHGDADQTVNLAANSLALRDRYRALGGQVDVVVVPNFGHVEDGIFQLTMVRFLTGLTPYPPMERADGLLFWWR